MKKYFFQASLLLLAQFSAAQQDPRIDTSLLKPVEIIATRAGEKTPVAKTNLSKKDIDRNNTAADIPFILREVPSLVSFSDAGNGIGYTGLRLRGSDATRVNVTLNNIPYNDAESQGTFFVDLPDIISSASSVQVQRGAGSSTNGAGSFGGTINISTNEVKAERKIELDNVAGSFGTLRNTLSFNSGIRGKGYTLDGRLSRVISNGYIDRAESNLRSFFISAAKVTDKSSLRINIFSGKEKTYQAWYGVAENKLDSDRTFNPAGTEKPGDPYENETDNYTQTHYQLFYNRKAGAYWRTSAAIFLTRGKGYYEQYKADQSLSNYGLPDYNDNGNVITSTDLVRRLWLDNYFYGALFSMQYQKGKNNIISGAGWNRYDGFHFGNIIWSAVAAAVPSNYKWYDLDASKSDMNLYTKWEHQLTKKWMIYTDLQLRKVNYEINGFRNNPGIRQDNNWLFFNPKTGISYSSRNWRAYLSYARAAKEPNRDDFEAGTNNTPGPEKLNDWEAGAEWKKNKASLSANLFWMDYRDQLILTGRINDVGAYTRINVPRSFRRGIELSGNMMISKKISFTANASFSQNRIKEFTEYIDDYDNGGQLEKIRKNTDIAFSPDLIAYARLDLSLIKDMTISLGSKYTGRQFMDNTSDNKRSLDPFFVQDIRLGYEKMLGKKIRSAWFLQLNNIFSERYEPNGYSFSYIYGGSLITENYFYPMALFNWMAGLKITLN